MATAHLIHGYLGAGKTTFARTLAAEVGGICLSRDEWYLRLYTDGAPTAAQDDAWLARVSGLLDGLWPEIVGHGTDVVLDFGFWRRAERDEARRLAEAVGGQAILYWARCDDETARVRCLGRQDAGSFAIDAAAFRALRRKYDPLAADEAHVVVESSSRP